MIVDSASDDQVYMYDGQHTDETGGDTQIEILTPAGERLLINVTYGHDGWGFEVVDAAILRHRRMRGPAGRREYEEWDKWPEQ